MVNTYDSVNHAIQHAKRRMSKFQEGMNKPSEYDPGTTVYKLVEELMVYLDEPVAEETPMKNKEDENRLLRG